MRLEIGSILFVSCKFRNILLTIDRVTETMAVAGEYKFQREYKDPKAIIGSGITPYFLAQIATPDIIHMMTEKDKRKKLIEKISGSRMRLLPTEDLEQIANLVEWKCRTLD